MSWFQNLANLAEPIARNAEAAVHEAAKHITSENIARGGQQLHQGLDAAVKELGNVAEMAAPHVRAGIASTSEIVGAVVHEASKHVNSESIARGSQQLHQGLDNAVKELGNAAEMAAPHVRAGIASTSEVIGKIAVENPTASAIIGTGVAIAVAPGIISAPLMAIAGAFGFTSGGVASASIAAGVQSAIGPVSAGGTFAFFQSAAAGGYGLTALTGFLQVAGVATAALGGLMGITTP